MESSCSRARASALDELPRLHVELSVGRNRPAQDQAMPNQQVRQQQSDHEMHSRVRLAREILETDNLQAAIARMTLSGTMGASEDSFDRNSKDLAQSPSEGTQERQRKRKSRADSPIEGAEEQELKKTRHSLSEADGHQAPQMQSKIEGRKPHRGMRGGVKAREREMKKEKKKALSDHAAAVLNAQNTTPNDDIITAFSQKLECGHVDYAWLVKLLNRDVDRLEAIKRIPGLVDNQDPEISTGLAHMVAAMKLEEARANLEGKDPVEFLEHHLLDMEDDLSHLRHKKEVLEKSVRKLFAYLEYIPPTVLSRDVKQRVAAALGGLPSA